jgi:hypothetical protein
LKIEILKIEQGQWKTLDPVLEPDVHRSRMESSGFVFKVMKYLCYENPLNKFSNLIAKCFSGQQKIMKHETNKT